MANGERALSSPCRGVSLASHSICEGPPPDRSVPKWVSPQGRKIDGSLMINQVPVAFGLSEKQKALRSPQGSTPPVSPTLARSPVAAPVGGRRRPTCPICLGAACFLLKVLVSRRLSAQPLLIFALCDLMCLPSCFSNASSLHLRHLFPWTPRWVNQTLQPLSPPSDDGPAALHPQGEPFEGVAFPSGEGVFVEGPGSSGRPPRDPPSAMAWRGQPGPSARLILHRLAS